MFATSDALFHEAIAVAITSGNVKAAFELSERARPRAILDGLELGSGQAALPPSLERIQRVLASDAAIVSYVASNDRVSAIVVRRNALVAFDLGPESPIRKLVTKFDRSTTSAGSERDVTAASDLFDSIVDPLRDALVGVRTVAWVPNNALRGTAFLGLYDRRRDRFIVEDYVSVEAPSAMVAVTASLHAGISNDARALIIAATSFDQQKFSELESIPAAAGEAQSVARLRDSSELLIGRNASRKNVLRDLSRYPILHFAGHVIRGRTPGEAALIVAPTTTEPGFLNARTIAELRLPKMRLAVLTACRSTTAGGRADGPESVAAAFLMAGVPTIVATPWPAEDQASSAFAERFHQALTDQTDPATEVCNVLRRQSRDHLNRALSPSIWAGFRAIGGTVFLVKNTSDALMRTRRRNVL